MSTLYEKSVSPYPGEITNAISCAQEYRPVYTKDHAGGRETHLFTGFATNRLTFGACTGDTIDHRAAVVIFFCEKQKRLYKLELFSPIKNSPESFYQEIKTIKSMPCG